MLHKIGVRLGAGCVNDIPPQVADYHLPNLFAFGSTYPALRGFHLNATPWIQGLDLNAKKMMGTEPKTWEQKRENEPSTS